METTDSEMNIRCPHCGEMVCVLGKVQGLSAVVVRGRCHKNGRPFKVSVPIKKGA